MNKAVDAVAGRECGACSMCCKLLAVGAPGEDFQKPQGVWCHFVHEDRRGCSIHDALPKSCANFKCVWLHGVFREQDRPDRSRIVVALEQSIGDRITDRNGRVIFEDSPVWCVYEREPGAAWGKRALAVIEELKTMTIRSEEGGPYEGPFPTCIISGPRATRMMRLPFSTEWVPCYRPDEVSDG